MALCHAMRFAVLYRINLHTVDVYKRQEQRELKERAAAIQAEFSKAQEATVNAEKFMNIVPVSYTHLDVYKRQGLYRRSGSGQTRHSQLQSPRCEEQG